MLGEASAGMRWAGTWPRMACSRAASMAACGCARAELCVSSCLDLGSGIGLRTGCVRGNSRQVRVTGKHISAYSWRQVDDEMTG